MNSTLYKILFKNDFSKLVCFFILFVTPIHTTLASLNKEPIAIQSDALELDQTQGLATYLGNVLLTQNGKELSADRIVIYRNVQGKIEKVLAFGKPAKYVGMLNNEALQGEANKITFLPNQQNMILEGQAKWVQKQDMFTAPYITYNFQNKMIRSKSQEGVRPTIIFHPN